MAPMLAVLQHRLVIQNKDGALTVSPHYLIIQNKDGAKVSSFDASIDHTTKMAPMFQVSQYHSITCFFRSKLFDVIVDCFRSLTWSYSSKMASTSSFVMGQDV
jgi:hypothetical protein